MRRLLYEMRRALQSPPRHPRLAVVVGRLLGAAFLICFGTGLYSHFLQNPIPGMVFPTSPATLYAWTQGIHVAAGIACFPLLLGKLYVVYPRLFVFPPVRGPIDLVERASIAVFVAASLVQIVTGLLNTYEWYPWPFPFRQTHYALAYVIIGSLVIHIGFKLPLIAEHWTKHRTVDAAGEPRPVMEESDDGARVPRDSVAPGDAPRGVTGRVIRWIDATPTAEPRVSRRAFLITTIAGVAGVVGLTAGQSFRALAPLNVFAPRTTGIGPSGLPVNRTAAAAKITDDLVGDDWRLAVRGSSGVERLFRYDELLAMPQHAVDLPIACVEGWSQMASWRGVRLKDLLAEVGRRPGEGVRISSMEVRGSSRRSEMSAQFIDDDRTLVALHLNGEVLDMDHGYPARIIAPARPGALQTKWLGTIEVTRS
ncbi:molybdopterin-dependent oxidoreductase [Pseudolysinimonas sp.]|uniref:molybdopterin-dependent oxidoreductase n=1 Tax=Pseudolysinimonas sp. TaxID=2680009 RepID=UPI003F7E75DA